MTEFSLNFREAAFSQDTERVLIALLTLTHDDLEAPIRLSTDPTQRLEIAEVPDIIYGTVSNGEEYIFFPMKLTLPDDKSSGIGELRVEIDNVHRLLTESIRSIQTPILCDVDLVLDNALDNIEASWPSFELVNVKYDAEKIKGTLKLDALLQEPFPSGAYTPAYFPGIFR